MAAKKEKEKSPDAIAAALAVPFAPPLLYWKPQSTNREKTRAIGAVYCDPRAYADRLNEVVGPEGWSAEYSTLVAPYHGFKGYRDDKEEKSGHKLVVVCKLTIAGLGAHQDVGEEDTFDENAATSAFAQAFKRACASFGLGRYLYDFPKGQWMDYDDKAKKIVKPPELAKWAIPPGWSKDNRGNWVYADKKKPVQAATAGNEPAGEATKDPVETGNEGQEGEAEKCADCKAEIGDYTVGDRTFSRDDVLANAQKKYNAVLCGPCQSKRRQAANPASQGRVA